MAEGEESKLKEENKTKFTQKVHKLISKSVGNIV